MRLASTSESKKIDELASSEFGISEESLMEAAGAVSAREITQTFVPELRSGKGRVVIVCGVGNNGGDGFVIARHLHSLGLKVRVLLLGPDAKRSPLNRLQLERLRRLGSDVKAFDSELLEPAALLVDAIFGIGLRNAVGEPFKSAIEALNARRPVPIVSIDTPSGLDADRGVAMGGGSAIRAHLTLTLGCAKPGFFVAEGPSLVGRLRVLKIGFPLELETRVACTRLAFTERMALSRLPRWSATSHKTDHGHALIVAGHQGTWGAGVLAASAAFRIGAGLVTLASHENPVRVLGKVPEIMTAAIDDARLWHKDRKWTTAAIGPGLGVGRETAALLRRLIDVGVERVVVDADAITTIAKEKIYPLPGSWILTPHAGELARILGVDARTIENDRFSFAQEAARKCGCLVLFKGFRSVLANENRCAVILSGNSALAKAGTGDVLTGMTAGLLAQNLRPAWAAATASYIHGRIADEWVRSGESRRSLTAGDLRVILPGLMARLAKAPSLR